MEQKRVSFKVAKAIEEAGYPQDNQPITKIGWYNKAGIYTNQLPTFWEGDDMFVAVAPTYIDVWLWLWREKKIYFGIEAESYPHSGTCVPSHIDAPFLDPEDAIEAEINYLVENNLINKLWNTKLKK